MHVLVRIQVRGLKSAFERIVNLRRPFPANLVEHTGATPTYSRDEFPYLIGKDPIATQEAPLAGATGHSLREAQVYAHTERGCRPGEFHGPSRVRHGCDERRAGENSLSVRTQNTIGHTGRESVIIGVDYQSRGHSIVRIWRRATGRPRSNGIGDEFIGYPRPSGKQHR